MLFSPLVFMPLLGSIGDLVLGGGFDLLVIILCLAYLSYWWRVGRLLDGWERLREGSDSLGKERDKALKLAKDNENLRRQVTALESTIEETKKERQPTLDGGGSERHLLLFRREVDVLRQQVTAEKYFSRAVRQSIESKSSAHRVGMLLLSHATGSFEPMVVGAILQDAADRSLWHCVCSLATVDDPVGFMSERTRRLLGSNLWCARNVEKLGGLAELGIVEIFLASKVRNRRPGHDPALLDEVIQELDIVPMPTDDSINERSAQ